MYVRIESTFTHIKIIVNSEFGVSFYLVWPQDDKISCTHLILISLNFVNSVSSQK